MKNKLISLTLAFAIIIASVLALGGCGNKDYPVQVANFTINEEPQNIVILDPAAADIVSYTGYDVKMVGRSNEVNQDWMSIVPTVGSAKNPDIDKIKESNATIVFADETLDSNAKQTLENNKIQVITMSKAYTTKQLETNYVTIGKILGGKVTGSNKGADSYKDLLSNMEKVKNTVTSSKSNDVLYTVCYLYNEGKTLKMMTNGSYGDMLLSYTGAVNAAVNIDDNNVDADTLKIANPNFIFYSNQKTLQMIKANPTLSQLTAVKNNKMLLISDSEMSRQGQTALDTLQKMINYMYPELAVKSTNDEASKAATSAATAKSVNAAASATQSATKAADTSVASKYKISLDKLSLKAEDENANVKKMQQRLYDLGYITDKENITGFYGDVSKSAVKAFQKNNGIKQTGTADNATLVALFDSNAKKAK